MGYLSVNDTDLTTIYNFSPAFDNLYTLELCPLDGADNSTISNIFRYHSPKVTMDGESLSMKRNDITKRFQFESNPYKRTDSIQVTLREDESWDVKKYHEDWLAHFYNRWGDHFISYDTEEAAYCLYRILRIYLPNSKDVVCMLILPSNTGGFNFNWGSGNIITHGITYNVESWKWEKNK